MKYGLIDNKITLLSIFMKKLLLLWISFWLLLAWNSAYWAALQTIYWESTSVGTSCPAWSVPRDSDTYRWWTSYTCVAHKYYGPHYLRGTSKHSHALCDWEDRVIWKLGTMIKCQRYDDFGPNGWFWSYNKWINSTVPISYNVSDTWGGWLKQVVLQRRQANISSDWSMWGWSGFSNVLSQNVSWSNSSWTYIQTFANQKAFQYQLVITDHAWNTSVIPWNSGWSLKMENWTPIVWITGISPTWTSTDQTASIQCADLLSGCDTSTYQYRVADSPLACNPAWTWVAWWTKTFTTPPNTSLLKYICFRAKDIAWNGYTYSWTPAEVKIDKIIPDASILDADDRNNDEWTTDDTTTITSTQNSSGPSPLHNEYCMDLQKNGKKHSSGILLEPATKTWVF